MKKNFSITKKNNIIFGVVFFIFFLITGFHSVIVGEEKAVRVWSVIFSLIFLIITITKPNFFTFPNRLWIQFGFLLGKIISPFVMGLAFFSVVTPIGMFLRILKKDIMGLKKEKSSYWIKREYKVQSMKKQF
jgi:polyferredoxin